MPKDVLITPASGLIDFKDTAGNIDAYIQLDDSGNLNITNAGGILSIGNTAANLYIGDGTNSVDIIFEQSGKIRALTNKTLTLGQSDSFVNTASPLGFVSPDGTKTITARMLNTDVLSFQGGAGELLSLSDSMSGTIYSVNDVSGIPSIEVLDTGLIKLAQYNGRVLIGTGTDNGVDELQVNGPILGTVLKSSVATGTAPLSITSTTKVTNLNADLLDGIDSTGITLSGDGLGGDFNQSALISSARIASIDANANTPFGNAWYTVYNARHRGGISDGNAWGSQIAIGMTAYQNKLAFRTQSSNTWSAWSEIIHVDSLLTAGNAVVGALKYNSTTAAAGQFDGGTTTPTGTTRLNYGGYFYPTFINLVGSGDTATAASHYFVETGSDGFVRPKTLANVQSEIVTTAVLGSGTANSTTFLRGDRTWATPPASAAAGGFWENDITLSTNYTITTNKNAMTAGPITIANGITITVPNGSTWTVV